MTELETLKYIREKYGSMIESAAHAYNHRPEVIAGMIHRESEGGFTLDANGKGDGGHGHGLMQIDDRSFPQFCQSEDWRDPVLNIKMGALILAAKRRYIINHCPGLRPERIERATIAAYNSGEGNVSILIEAGIDVDSKTAHGNYSRDVLRRAELYRNLEA
jgi:soluble lytic murein transglycosylase-like protein